MRTRALAGAVLLAGSLPLTAAAATTTTVAPAPHQQFMIDAGGGLNTYTQGFDQITKPGAAYGVRVTWGMHMPVGVEAAFTGAINPLRNLGGSPLADNNLMSNGGEALLRVNLAPRNAIVPYVALGGGVADTRIVDDKGKTVTTSVPGTGTPTSGPTFGKESTRFYLPAAAGVDAFIGNLALGGRFAYRYEFQNNLRTDVASADIQSWQATARVGVAF